MAEMTLNVTTAEYGVKFYAEASPISYAEYANNVRFIFRLYKNGNSVDYKSVRATYLGEDKWSASYENNSLERGSKYTYSVSATTVSTSPSVDFATNRGEFTPWRNNKHLVGKEAYSLDYDNAKNSYTKVRIVIDDNADPYEYGTDVGRTLEIKNPWVAYPPESEDARDRTIHAYADDVAQDILTRVNGYSYQPFDAKGAFLDDDAELGDAVWFEGVYGAVISQDITFDGLGNSDVSAPNGEDNENEFGDYVPSGDSSTEAQIARLRTSFIVQYGLIQSTIESLDDDLSSQIEQRLDSISLSVSSSNGTTSFVLKDGETTLDSKVVNLHVNAINIDGLIRANQIEAISVKAHDLYGQTVTLYDSDETTSVGYFQLTDTQTGTGVQIQSKAGIKIKAGTSYGNYGNIYLEGGETLYLVPAKFTMESGAIRMSANALVLEAQGVGQAQYNYFYNADSPSTHISNPVTGQLYFQLVT